MCDERVIIYGMGSHAKTILSEYNVPIKYIEMVIDNSPKEVKTLLEGSGINVFTWEEFIKMGVTSKCKIVVSSTLYRKEIEKQILECGLFQSNQIVYIDDWILQFSDKGIGSLIKYNSNKYRKKVPSIKEVALKNAVLLPNRVSVLMKLPQNLVVAEVGVAYGDFSKKIYEIMKPAKFYGIDIFSEHIKGFWGGKVFEQTEMNHLLWYENRFRTEINTGRFEVCQGLSWDVLEKFPDGYFDYVYLDASHEYNNVFRDVEVLKKKIKNGGIIQFNDYIIYDYVGNVFYGVVQVVNQLLNESNSEVLYYCLSENGFDDIVVRYLR